MGMGGKWGAADSGSRHGFYGVAHNTDVTARLSVGSAVQARPSRW
jgi:hypothetical protein